MVFLFGIDVPLIEFLFFLSIINIFNFGLVIYLLLRLHRDIKDFRLAFHISSTRSAPAPAATQPSPTTPQQQPYQEKYTY